MLYKNTLAREQLIIEFISDAPKSSVEIAAYLNVKRRALTYNLTAMQDMQKITKMKAPRDGRGVYYIYGLYDKDYVMPVAEKKISVQRLRKRDIDPSARSWAFLREKVFVT